MLRVVGVQPLSAFNAKWGRLKLIHRASGRTVELQDTAPASAGYSLFIGGLPPGQYAVSGFSSDGVTGGFGLLPALVLASMTSDSQPLDAQLGTFTVKAGELNNLGIVVSSLPDGKGAQAQVAVLADTLAQATNLRDLDAASRERIKAMVTNAWDRPHDAQASARALEIVRTRARNVSAIELADDQRVLIGSALGMVHVRSGPAQWSSHSTGSLDNISYVRALADGRLFAGTDTSRCYVWTPGERAWQAFTVGDGERVTQLEPLGDLGFAIMVSAYSAGPFPVPSRHRVLVKKDLADTAEWKSVLTLSGVSALGKMPMYFDGQALQVYFNHAGISRTADVHRIDLASLQAKVAQADHWGLDTYRPAPGLLVRERMNGLDIFSDFSIDGGTTWVRGETSGPISMRFAGRQDGYGLTLQSRGWDTVTLVLQKTQDGGKSWQKSGVPFEAAGPSAIRLVGKTIFVFTGLKLLSTQDEGQSWQVEWPASMVATKPP